MKRNEIAGFNEKPPRVPLAAFCVSWPPRVADDWDLRQSIRRLTKDATDAKTGRCGRNFCGVTPGLPGKSDGSRLRRKDGSLQWTAKRQQTFGIIWAYKRCFASFANRENAASADVSKT